MLLKLLIPGLLAWAHLVYSLSVDISIQPSRLLKDRWYIKTHNSINFTAEVSGIEPNASLIFEWSSSNVTIPGNTSSIAHVFDTTNEDSTIKVLVRQNDTQLNATAIKKLAIRDEIMIIKRDYKQHIYHGDLFSATFTINGTPPVYYCHELCHNSTRNHNCWPEECHTTFGPDIITKPIYLHVGSYVLNLSLENIASKLSQSIAIKVIETAREQGVNYVPIICSVLAVLILVTGFALNLKFKKSAFTETADFDFTRNTYEDEEWDEVQTLGERVRYLLFGLNRNEQRGLLNSELNRSRTRLI